jgi:hypothetical protein
MITLPTEPLLGNLYGGDPKKNREKLDRHRQSMVFGSGDTQGAIAQLGERLNGIQEVSGSIPLSSTKIPKSLNN